MRVQLLKRKELRVIRIKTLLSKKTRQVLKKRTKV